MKCPDSRTVLVQDLVAWDRKIQRTGRLQVPPWTVEVLLGESETCSSRRMDLDSGNECRGHPVKTNNCALMPGW